MVYWTFHLILLYVELDTILILFIVPMHTPQLFNLHLCQAPLIYGITHLLRPLELQLSIHVSHLPYLYLCSATMLLSRLYSLF